MQGPQISTRRLFFPFFFIEKKNYDKTTITGEMKALWKIQYEKKKLSEKKIAMTAVIVELYGKKKKKTSS